MKQRTWLMMALSIPVTLVLIFAACGGDDDDGANGRGGSDESYVSAVCGAAVHFLATFDDIDNADPDELLELLIESTEHYLETLEGINPPSDIEDFHGEVVKAFEDLLKAFEEGDDSVLLSEGDPFPEPPAEVAARLNALAEQNEDCIEADLSFGE
ncbi:MAG TPA: hypothetical protein QGF35_07790 [Dehalococcoidia bacterium]|nr:hypothetical protein [Dehalococcoidia bacterium]